MVFHWYLFTTFSLPIQRQACRLLLQMMLQRTFSHILSCIPVRCFLGCILHSGILGHILLASIQLFDVTIFAIFFCCEVASQFKWCILECLSSLIILSHWILTSNMLNWVFFPFNDITGKFQFSNWEASVKVTYLNILHSLKQGEHLQRKKIQRIGEPD